MSFGTEAAGETCGDAAAAVTGPPQATAAEPVQASLASEQAAATEQAAAIGQQRKRRRAQRAAPAGSDPAPFDPPTERRSESENDARLRADRPPHWG